MCVHHKHSMFARAVVAVASGSILIFFLALFLACSVAQRNPRSFAKGRLGSASDAAAPISSDVS